MGLTLTKLYDYFDAAALVEGSTKVKCRTALRKLLAFAGDIDTTEITRELIARWQLWCMESGGLRRTSVPGYVASISQMLTWAVDGGDIAANPIHGVRKIRPDRPEVVTFAADEVGDLIEAAAVLHNPDPSAALRWTGLMLLCSDSALRINEAINLRREDIDVDAGLVHICRRNDKPGEYWRWGSKGHKNRYAPLGQEGQNLYARLLEVAPWRYPHLKEPRCQRLQALVGCLPEAVRKRPYNNLYGEWAKIRAYAQGRRRIQGKPPIQAGALHQMRKTAVTEWLRRGVPISDVQAVAGHASRQTTLTYYDATVRTAAVENVRTVLNSR